MRLGMGMKKKLKSAGSGGCGCGGERWGLEMISRENECNSGCEDTPKKKGIRVGKLLLVPMNSESREMLAWG